MSDDRLELLFVSPFPAGPPTFGAQRRIAGLMAALARRHGVCGAALVPFGWDREAAARAMAAYCEEVALVPAPPDRGLVKRLGQVRSLVSRASHERRIASVAAFRAAVGELLGRRRFDVVTLEFPFQAHYALRRSPPGAPPPLLVLDQHNIEHDLARQSRDASRGLLRRLHHGRNWRKLLTEEVAAWRGADGVTFTSADDARRACALHPDLRAAVVPNAVDLEHFRPDPELPPPDGRTLVFFGTMRYFPNLDGVRYLLAEIWPRIARHPGARLKVIGQTVPEVQRQHGGRLEIVGLVDDLRPHLAQAAAVLVPLRVGGGTRFKILEAMAMGRPVVSTTVGAEGIAARPGRDLLLADDPEAFAAAAIRVLADPGLGRSLGAAGREVVERSYSWRAAAEAYEQFVRSLREVPPRAASTEGWRAAEPVP